MKDGKAEDLTRQPEQVKAFRDTWQLGIHSYLSYLRDRLVAARGLLTETGSVFVQIGDENVHLARNVLDEVFGGDNFVSLISFRKTSNLTALYLPTSTDFILWYAKDHATVKYRQIFTEKDFQNVSSDTFGCAELPDRTWRRLTQEEKLAPQSLPKEWRLFGLSDLTSSHFYESPSFEFEGKRFTPKGRYWSTSISGLKNLKAACRLTAVGDTLRYMRFMDDFPVMTLNSQWNDTGTGTQTDDRVYVVQTSSKVIERCLLMVSDPGDLVLDPTCGSGTTAYVAEEWGRRWITIDTSRVALALARTRLMAAKYPYYILADSPEGVAKESNLMGRMTPAQKTEGDIKKGFVYKRVPHVTLKSIANNPDIKEGMRREEIDAAIARHAETEILYDQPYEDPKRIRVTGPFTVESLSPHRVLSTDEERPTSERAGQRDATAGQFETMILENLKKAGVQTTVRSERLMFDRLESYAGEWIHAAGEYTEKNGATRRAAISLGPEHGTVGPEQVKEAAKEALKGAGFDLLVVCGFAFDAHANETAKEFSPDLPKKPDFVAESDKTKRYGKMTVLLARMNPDLAMGDELLKKTGAGNLFMVFGEPDLKVTKEKDGRIVVEVRGVDVYDPTTRQIRSSSTDDIACWFLDTNYNSESFFVRHAYFTGADEPYEKLKRALRAEIDEAAWSALYSTKSRPFAPPKTGKIAIKIINHYGDEVLKVYTV